MLKHSVQETGLNVKVQEKNKCQHIYVVNVQQKNNQTKILHRNSVWCKDCLSETPLPFPTAAYSVLCTSPHPLWVNMAYIYFH